MTVSVSTLFQPISLGGQLFPNRIVMAPMTRRRADDGKIPGPVVAQYYAQRASAGLIISESIEVDPHSELRGPTRPGLFTDAQEAGWKTVVSAVHAAGGRIFAQLSHMGRAVLTAQLQPGGRVVGPSAIAADGHVYTASGRQTYETPHPLSIPEIQGIIAQFADAARRARAAGFDGIELQAANGYLIDQFLRDGSNQRDDDYGGSAENRTRFLLEVFAAVEQHWPTDRIGIRLSPTNPFQGMSDSDPVGHYGTIADILSTIGPAYLHIVEPVIQREGIPIVAPVIRSRFAGPIILAGQYDGPTAHAAIAAGQADLIAFGEKFIGNPDLPDRLRRGAELVVSDKATHYAGGPVGYIDYPAQPSYEETVTHPAILV